MWWEHLDFASSNINAHLLRSVPLLQQNAEKCVFHTQQVKHAQENYNHANTFIIWCFQLTVHVLCWLEIEVWFVTGTAQAPFSHQAPPLPLWGWDQGTTSCPPVTAGSWHCSTAIRCHHKHWSPLQPSQIQDYLRDKLPGSKGQHFTPIFLLCFLYDRNHVWFCRGSSTRREKWH